MVIVCKNHLVNRKEKGRSKNLYPAFEVRPMNCTETNKQVDFISILSHILSSIRSVNLSSALV